jgi:organic radical activating enzyme
MDKAWPEAPGEQRWCVLTGGEPALQLDEPLLDALQNAGWKVAVETNGSVANETLEWCDWVTCSPKLGGNVVLEKADELKVVLPGHVDPKQGWTDEDLELLASVVKAGVKIVNPMDPCGDLVAQTHLLGNLPGAGGQFDTNMKRCLTFVQTHPSWRLGAQLHKLWKLP